MTPTKAPLHKLYLIKRSPPEADRRGSVDRNASRVVAVRIEADARPFPKSGAGSGCLTHELGEDDDALALDAAFDVLGVIIDDHDVSHRGSPFRREVGAFDVQIFDNLRKKKWYIAPLTSSIIGSTVDTFLFFSISFYATGVPWVTLLLGDLIVKVLVALIMLIPFRLLLKTFKPV